MVIDEKILHDDLYEIMKSQVQQDFHHGLFDDHLLTLSYMSTTLSQRQKLDYETLVDIWIRYRIHNQIQKVYMKDPEVFEGFKEVKDSANLNQLLDLGAIFVSFHYGHDRYAPLEVGKKLREKDRYLYLITDPEETVEEQWVTYQQKFHVDDLASDGVFHDPKVESLISKNENVFFYLDDKVGFDEEVSPFKVKFMSKSQKAPSSIFRLAVKFQKPICFIHSTLNEAGEPILHIYGPLWVQDNEIKGSVQFIYELFEEELWEKPYLWKKWHRYKPLEEYADEMINRADPNIDVLNRWGTHGLNIQSGLIYQIASSVFAAK
ncbi:hypothetical protein LGQ02_04125 [Bacillus shivajii]|uniref:hypothetical protein n=1 Tax=Bacillus shivajii TaxID=1983719 RepID=UPI001CFB5C35|nr:hypothetical protein [Bacillus shivajii]UCZ53979.1 hypothetical protein LGQ02_04125 [Bacillus shivajii]